MDANTNTMRIEALLALLPVLGAHGIRIIQSNDDGWAEQYARTFHDALLASGHDAVLSAPAENKSGSGTPSTAMLISFARADEAARFDGCGTQSQVERLPVQQLPGR